jgi:chorismate mutase/prephenate dehydratase
VKAGKIRYGIVPIENSSTGLIPEVIESWLTTGSGCHVLAEQSLIIKHCLAGHAEWKRLSSIVSHPEVYKQCKRTLGELTVAEGARLESVSSTAEAARTVSESITGMETAAICSKFAAGIYRLKIIREDVSDHELNATRFHLIAHEAVQLVAPDEFTKVACIFGLKHEPGALANVLDLLRIAGANVSSIHSIPRGNLENYMFYLEFRYSEMNDIRWDELYEILKAITKDLQLVGEFREYSEPDYP